MNNLEKEAMIEIVPTTVEDVRGIQEVQYRTWLATYPSEEYGVTAEDVEDLFGDAFSEQTIAKRTAEVESGGTSIFLTAKEDGKVVGFCRISSHEDKNKLRAIYVLPEFQGKGIGMKLWNRARDRIDFS